MSENVVPANEIALVYAKYKQLHWILRTATQQVLSWHQHQVNPLTAEMNMVLHQNEKEYGEQKHSSMQMAATTTPSSTKQSVCQCKSVVANLSRKNKQPWFHNVNNLPNAFKMS